MLPKLYTFTSEGGDVRRVLSFTLGCALEHLEKTKGGEYPLLPLLHYNYVEVEDVEVPDVLLEERKRRIAQGARATLIVERLRAVYNKWNWSYHEKAQELYQLVKDILREERERKERNDEEGAQAG